MSTVAEHNAAECSVQTGGTERKGRGVEGGGGDGEKKKVLAGSLCYSTHALGSGCSEEGRREEKGEKKKSMLSNAEIGKCHFDKCKALCTHRLNFDGSLPRRGLLLLFIGLRIKMLNNDVTRMKIQNVIEQNNVTPEILDLLLFSNRAG